MEPVIARLQRHLELTDPGGVRGAYVHGSSASGGLRPDSDIDVLVVTERSLDLAERRSLLTFLQRFSGRRATVSPGRPLDMSVLVAGDVVPWTYPPWCDFLYGEWLRDDYAHGDLPQRHPNPDVAVLVTSVRQHAQGLSGPPPEDVLAPVPEEDLRRAIQDSLEPLLGDLVGDERNVLLTLVRMVVTLETGRIVAKDEAADMVASTLPEGPRRTLRLAARGYLGLVRDDWRDRRHEAREAADLLGERVRRAMP